MSGAGGPVRVRVLSPYPITRQGVTSLLARAGEGVTVVDPGSDGDHAVEVVLYDLILVMDGSVSELCRLATGPARVVGIGVPGRSDLTHTALSLGVVDVVPRSADGPQLVAAVQRAVVGHVLRPEAHRAAMHADVYAKYGVTPREAAILALIASGLSNHEIAEHLFLSVNSVKTYIRTAYRRIGVGSRSEAVLWVLRHNLAEADPRVSVAEGDQRPV
jgi:NarL family two-component system response regulator LiaR